MASTSRSKVTEECQICAKNTHKADRCPFLNAKCRKPRCNGMRMLLISGTEKNPQRKFLKCHLDDCQDFQWLDEAILQAEGYSVPVYSCFSCGSPDHWKDDCPWNNTPCNKPKCNGTRDLKTTKSGLNKGKQFLKCSDCGSFQWFSKPMEDEGEKQICVNAKLVIELDTMCAKFADKVVLK